MKPALTHLSTRQYPTYGKDLAMGEALREIVWNNISESKSPVFWVIILCD